MSSAREAAPQILAVTVKSVLLLGFGMTLGYPTILIPAFSSTSAEEDSFRLNQEQISWIGSVNLICVPLGCVASGAVTQIVGRKRAMQLNNIPFLAAWLLFRYSTDVWQVFLALVITGLNGGLLEAPVITYVAEITQPHLRGMLSSTSTLAVILGVLMQFLLGSFYHWRTVALINCSVPIISIILLFFVPESPHWLIMKNRFETAKEGIAWLRGWTTIERIEPEFRELCRTLGKNPINRSDNPSLEDKTNNSNKHEITRSKLDTLKLFKKRSFICPYSLVTFTFFLAHFCGMTTLQTYAVNIFATLHSPINKYYATIILGAVELLGCTICMLIIPYTGKRKLNLVCLVLCSICMFVVATYAYTNDIRYLDSGSVNITSIAESHPPVTNTWIPMTFLILFAFISHMSIRVLPWILTGEIYSNETRAFASGLTSGISYILGFLTNKVFFTMISGLTLPGTFWLYSSVGFLGTVVLYLVLPETEGKTLHEITEHFAGKKKLDRKVYRKRQINLNGGVINNGYCHTEEDSKHQLDSRL